MRFVDRSKTKPKYSLSNVQGKSYKSTYVKKHLVQSYGLKCCFCESRIDSASYWEVEHLYPQKHHKGLINVTENLHLACKRCNMHKKTFNGDCLSPNYYLNSSTGAWMLSNDKFITSNLWYEGDEVKTSTTYMQFANALRLNGSNSTEIQGLHLALRQNRKKYLDETTSLLQVCLSLYGKSMFQDCLALLRVVSVRFCDNAVYSSMIIRNLGKGYTDLVAKLQSHGYKI